MRRHLSIAILLLQVSVLLLGALPQGLYALYPAMFAAHCVNKAKPSQHCKGRCQMRKATASALGVATGASLRTETPARIEMPCIAAESFVLSEPRPPADARPPASRARVESRSCRPDVPPPKAA